MRLFTLACASALGLMVVTASTLAQPPGQGDGGRERGGGERGGGDRGGRGGRGGFGSFGAFGGGFGGFGPASALDVVNQDNAAAELKLTEDEKTKLRELRDEQRTKSQTLGGDMSRIRDLSEEERTTFFAEMNKSREALRKEYDEKLKALLKPEQFARANQLSLHQFGAPALVRDEFVAELKITDDQKTKIQAVIDESRPQFGGGGRGFGQRPSREDMLAQNKARDEKILAILTADQKKAWETKLGPAPVELAVTPGATTPGTPAPMTVVGPAPRAPGVMDIPKPAGASVMLETSPEAVAKIAGPEIDPDKKIISFSFRFAPWEEVLKYIAKEAGLSVEFSKIPPGTFNYLDSGKYTVTEALDVINGHLLQKNHLLVKRDKFLVCISVDDPVPANLIPEVTVEDLPKRGRFELLTLVIQLEGIDSATAIEEVKEMLGPQGKAVPLSKTNRIVVTDIGSNLQRIHRLLTGADVVQEKTATNFKAFQLKHIAALDAERHVRDLFGLPARGRTAAAAAPATTTSSGRSGWDFRGGGFSGGDFRGGWGDRGGDRDRGDRGQPQMAVAQQPAAANSKTEDIQVSSDTRTNSLLVAATAAKLEIVSEVIKSIDVDQDGQGNRITRALNTPQLEVYPLANVELSVAVEAINGILPGLQITQDAKGRRLSVYATPDEQAQVAGILKQLNDGGTSESSGGVAVIPLKKNDPLAVAASLRSLFDSRSVDKPNIEADSAGKRLIVRATSEQIMQIRKVLEGIGEDGNLQTTASSQGGNVRTYAVGRDPEELVSMLKVLWGEQKANPIKVVVPSALTPRVERQTPSVEPTKLEPPVSRAAPRSASEKPVESGRTGGGSGGQEPAPESNATESSATGSQPASEEPAAPDQPQASTGEFPVNIAIVGDRLIVTSSDTAALDRFEQILQTYTQMAQARPRWTVFHLRSIDAAEAATMLGQLIPASSVARTEDSSSIMGSFSSSLTSLGSSLMDASGLGSLGDSAALRIIPETRSNSLWVSGTEDQLEQIKLFLMQLDADELPETLKDRVPRRIALEHADASEVLSIVEEVYREQLSGGQQQQGGRGGRGGEQQQQGFNPLAMLMGGQQNNRRGVQMTIGADTRTNTLIISASDSLFKQVETMVLAIDKAADEAERTVQVVDLKAANSQIVQQALTSLLGKVNVSTTAQRSDSNRSSGTPQFGQSPFSQFGQSPFGQQGQSPFGSRGTFGTSSQPGGSFSGFGNRGGGDRGSFGNFGGGDRGSFSGFGNRGGGDRGGRGGRD